MPRLIESEFNVRSFCPALQAYAKLGEDVSHRPLLDYSQKLFHRWDREYFIKYTQRVCRNCGSLYVEREVSRREDEDV